MLENIFNKQKPTIAVSFKDENSLENLIILKNENNLDVAELRVDLFAGDISADTIITELNKFKKAQIPTILTIRANEEGGNWLKNDLIRVDLIDKCFTYADIIDIELASVCQREYSEQFLNILEKIKKENKKIILSYHNFLTTPSLEELQETIKKSKDKKADIIKIACVTNNQEDLIILTQLLINNREDNLIVIAMGEFGALSRLSFMAYGSLLTFAYVGEASAPGQIKLTETVKYLKELYINY